MNPRKWTRAFVAALLLSMFCAHRLPAQSLTVLHYFSGLSSGANGDGAKPNDGLLQAGDTLYGAAAQGGVNTAGTIFSISTSGSNFAVLHYFAPLGFVSVSDFTLTNSDGYNPSGNLAISGDTLFGYTTLGGLYGNGTVFSMSTNGGNFTVLHTFSAIPVSTNFLQPFPRTNSDGANPSGLICVNNVLFGTAKLGGANASGTVFSLSTNGDFAVIHHLAGTNPVVAPEGANPVGNLVFSNDVLFGVAEGGGANGSGSVFAVTYNGTFFETLYSFPLLGSYPYQAPNGAEPLAGPLLSGNNIYGSAYLAGTTGSGTLFKLVGGTNFVVIHTFGALSDSNTNADGGLPLDGFALSGSTLYGVGKVGGAGGQGTIFSLDTSGSNFTTLYSFSALSNSTNLDGAQPNGNLVFSGDTLYGTTGIGGTNGSGAIFALALGTAAPPALSIGGISIAAGSNLIFNIPNATAGTAYTVLISSNMFLPLGKWTPIVTNVAGTSGPLTIAVTNTVSPAVSGRFYILRK